MLFPVFGLPLRQIWMILLLKFLLVWESTAHSLSPSWNLWTFTNFPSLIFRTREFILSAQRASGTRRRTLRPAEILNSRRYTDWSPCSIIWLNGIKWLFLVHECFLEMILSSLQLWRFPACDLFLWLLIYPALKLEDKRFKKKKKSFLE